MTTAVMLALRGRVVERRRRMPGGLLWGLRAEEVEGGESVEVAVEVVEVVEVRDVRVDEGAVLVLVLVDVLVLPGGMGESHLGEACEEEAVCEGDAKEDSGVSVSLRLEAREREQQSEEAAASVGWWW